MLWIAFVEAFVLPLLLPELLLDCSLGLKVPPDFG
jgi:hypothetical protein